MPVRPEREDEKPARRGHGRPWVLMGFLALGVVLVSLHLEQAVVLQLGDTVVAAEAVRVIPPLPGDPPLPQGYSRLEAGALHLAGKNYDSVETASVHRLRVGGWLGYVTWFKGRRMTDGY
jgi:hypothetical protein